MYIEINVCWNFTDVVTDNTFAPGLKTGYYMTNWLIIGGIMLCVFTAKCIKELIDVRAMSRMVPQERKTVLERRNFYDNHA